jgi:PAS domain S-box-containing protein
MNAPVQPPNDDSSRSSTRQKRGSPQESEQRLSAILRTAVEGIITIDDRGTVESVNPAAERMFGYAASELIGSNISRLMPAPFRQEHDKYIQNYVRTGQAKVIGIGREVVGQRKNGSLFPIELSVSEVKLRDRHLFTGFVRDITERKRLESEVLEISEREQRRIGQDLHDGLGQHLAGIELMSQALQQKLAKSRSKDARKAGAVVEDLTRYVREAISHTRLLARGLSPVVVESEGLMAALHQLAANTQQMLQISCSFECEPEVLVANPTVASHVYRIAQEATSNAIKHAKPSEIKIRLRKAGERIVLMVKDDGIGLPEPPPMNKGLGLRIMQYRAGMIGGSLVVQRDPDGGTSVACSVRIPPKPPTPTS